MVLTKRSAWAFRFGELGGSFTDCMRFLVHFLIDLSSRRVEIAGLARQVNGLWMSQVTRNLSDAAEGFLVGKHYLIHDRDPLFTAEFLVGLAASGNPWNR